MSLWYWLAAGYFIGAVGTLIYNLHGMVYVSHPLVILRNAIFWPFFLPIIIVMKRIY